MQETMHHQPKDYDALRELEGFSEELVSTHLGLYEGYVKHANKAHGLLHSGDLDDYTAGEVRRRFVWEFNGMRLHELFFDALTPGGSDLDRDGPFCKAVNASFGGVDSWMKDLRAVAGMRGIGWAAVIRDPATGRLHNQWINEHDAGALAGGEPLFLIDVFEHAFIRDFGTDKDSYLDALFDNVDWDRVATRCS